MSSTTDSPSPLEWARKPISIPANVLRTWLGILLPLLLLGALSEDVWEGESFRIDNPTLLWIHGHSSPAFDRVMVATSAVGGGFLIVVAALWAGILLAKKRRWEALFLVLSLGGAALLNVTAKLVFGRVRPDLWLSLTPQDDYSFPSGHAMMSSAFIGAALFLLWRAEIPRWLKISGTVAGVIFVLGVGFSRLYLGVHFPSDILGGWSASILWVTLLRRFLPKA